MIHNYYISSLETKLDFGKHNGELFCDVMVDDPTYIYWCAKNIPEFGIHPDVIKQIMEFDKSIILPIQLERKVGEPEKFRPIIREDYEEDESDYYDDTEDYYYREEPTYERYRGSYAQDEMGYSDDEIDTIFDGDPLAYWNID